MKTVSGISFLFQKSLTPSFDKIAFQSQIEKLFQGGIVNESENRAAWHTEFRNPTPCETVKKSLDQIKKFSDDIRSNHFLFPVTDVVNIGIGGSDLGPQLICNAFANDAKPTIHFISNLDSTEINALLKKLSAKNTLFIATSKSFTTLETLSNMMIAKKWLQDSGCDEKNHIVAVTNNTVIAKEKYGIPDSHIFPIPEWMGGRFSIWSAVGLSCAIALGFDVFYQLHQGAHEMDQYFYTEKTDENAIVQYALLLQEGLQKYNLKTLVVLPYTSKLQKFPAYLQQLLMESLGKSVNTKGVEIQYPTGPIVFGDVGTNSQHSFQQLMMQGTHPVFADFILPLEQSGMITNCITQVTVLRNGAANPEVIKKIQGGKIANLFVLEKLDLKTMGALIAFYEQVVFTMGFLLDINPFDQFGVEYAKSESARLSKVLKDEIPSLEWIGDQLTAHQPN